MAHAKDTYTADGSTQSFAVTFPFISRDHVSVTADGSTATFTWVNNGQITITSPAALTTEAIIIKRSTSPTALLVDFVDGANLTEADLDLLATQMFYLAQENIDEAGSVSFADLDEFADSAVSTTDADILVSNGTEFDNVAVSGDITITNAGVTAIGASKVTSAMILNDEIVDADINSSAAIDATKIGGGGVTSAEFDFMAGVTSDVQTQLDNIVAGAFTNNIVEDLTPQLGGDLDLNGKNLDFPTTANISDVLDEDTMTSDSATKLATQQSIKAYVDTEVAAGGGASNGFVIAMAVAL
jgi:hypothetical protein